MHFWCPNLNKAISSKVKACLPCQAHTDKRTKEPQAMLQLPRSAWDKVSPDLVGPTPTGKHILEAQDVLTRFPAAHIVPGTKASSVLSAMDNIYVSYGYPDIHITDNGPPFNSDQFSAYSRQTGITNQQIYPYHSQANPAEPVMKPLGKALKTAAMDHRTEQEALKESLVSYRAIPHIATGVPPGDFLFRDEYRADYPFRKPIGKEQVANARDYDQAYNEAIQDKVNKSMKRRKDNIEVGDKVLPKKEQYSF